MQQKVSETIGQMTAKIRAHTNLPIAVGFGISTPEQARFVAQHAEAIVVGSAVVNQIAEHGKSAGLIEQAIAYRWSSARFWSRCPAEDEAIRVDVDKIVWRRS